MKKYANEKLTGAAQVQYMRRRFAGCAECLAAQCAGSKCTAGAARVDVAPLAVLAAVSKSGPLFPTCSGLKEGRQPLKFGNMKLPASTAIFNLPPVQTCGRHCAGCYAMKAQRQYKTARAYRAEMLYFTGLASFVPAVIAQIRERLAKGAAGRIKSNNRLRAVRVHESGDFYSVAYIKKWAAIARALPAVRFYAYTKRLDGRAVNKEMAAALRRYIKPLANFVLIDSAQYGDAIGGAHVQQRGAVNYGTREELAPALAKGAFLCPCRPGDNKKICGAADGCAYCMKKRAQNFAPVFLNH